MPPGPRTGNSPSWQPTSPGSSGTGPGSPPPGDEDDKSPVTGDRHAGICGSRGLQCPRLPDPGQDPSRLMNLALPDGTGGVSLSLDPPMDRGSVLFCAGMGVKASGREVAAGLPGF